MSFMNSISLAIQQSSILSKTLQFNLTSFAHNIVSRKGTKKFDYGGGRKKDEIIQWMNK